MYVVKIACERPDDAGRSLSQWDCVEIARQHPRLTVFTGQLIFQRDTWYQRLLHNFTAFALQRRLQWRGLSMVIF